MMSYKSSWPGGKAVRAPSQASGQFWGPRPTRASNKNPKRYNSDLHAGSDVRLQGHQSGKLDNRPFDNLPPRRVGSQFASALGYEELQGRSKSPAWDSTPPFTDFGSVRPPGLT